MMRLCCFLFVIASPLFGIGSCSDSGVSKFDQNQRVWKSRNIANYRYKLGMECYCPVQYVGPNLIEVRNGKTESITYAGDSKNINMKDVKLPDTMDKLFELARGRSDKSVAYDPTYGYPRMIHSIGRPGTQDTSTIYSIRDFEVIK
jgi:hypothetical protein